MLQQLARALPAMPEPSASPHVGSKRSRREAALSPDGAPESKMREECERCAAACPTASALKRHISIVHLGIKPHACKHCDAAFQLR